MTDANTKNEVEMTHNAPAENQVSPETGKNAADATAEQHGTDDKFENKLQYWLSCIGFAVGFGNVWRFPHMCYSSGGAAFLVPYFFCFFFIAVPLFLIETAYGQLIDCRLHLRWGAIFRRLWGVKVLQVCICFGTLIYYITLMAWSFRFLFSCFQSELPWMLSTAEDGSKVEDLWNENFFNDVVMQKSSDINVQGGMVGPLVGCLVLSYFVTYFSAWKGIQSTGKMVYVTCLLPYVILTILLIKGLTLKGCGEGLNFLFLPNWDIVAKTDTWRKAATQILFSSGVAYGPFMYYGSCRQKTDKIVAVSFWIPFANSATSIYAALTVFSFIGHVSVSKSIPIDKVAASGPTLFFVAFPALLGLLPGANFWAILFFIMAVCLGIDSVFGFFDYYIKIAEDAFPLLRTKLRKELQVLVITIFSFIWSLMFVVEGGAYNFDLFDANAGHIQLLLVLFMQTILLPWVFGMHKLSTLIYLRTGQYVPIFYVLVVRIFVPIFSLIILIIAIVNEFGDIDERVANKWTNGHIWGARMIWLLPILAMLALIPFPRPDQPAIADLILQQYGIAFDDSDLTFIQKVYTNKCSYKIENQEVWNTIEFGGMLDNKADAKVEGAE